LVGITDIKFVPYCSLKYRQSFMAAILAIAYGSLVGSRGPDKRYSSLSGCGASFGYMQDDPRFRSFLTPALYDAWMIFAAIVILS